MTATSAKPNANGAKAGPKLLGITLGDLAELEGHGIRFDLDKLSALEEGGDLPLPLLVGFCWIRLRHSRPGMTIEDAWALDLGEVGEALGEFAPKGKG